MHRVAHKTAQHSTGPLAPADTEFPELHACFPRPRYAVLLARGSKRFHEISRYGSLPRWAPEVKAGANLAVPVGRFHRRGVVLPAAVSEHGGPLTMRISHVAGCSSLQPMTQHAPRFCRNAMENRTVETFSMADALELLPPVRAAPRIRPHTRQRGRS